MKKHEILDTGIYSHYPYEIHESVNLESDKYDWLWAFVAIPLGYFLAVAIMLIK